MIYMIVPFSDANVVFPPLNKMGIIVLYTKPRGLMMKFRLGLAGPAS